MLQLKNIKKNYELGELTIRALDGIDLSFRKNEFVSILGPSGCGKTTMLNLVGGLDRYSSGDILIENRSTKDFKDRDWDTYRNHRVGFVFQNYNLIPHLSVLQNVELALTLSGISPKERKERATDALSHVGLKDQVNKKPNQLSGGQMQRVAIARALVNDPEILLADEPTGALDSKTSEQIMKLIQKIAEDRLVIMVTHNADIAHQYSNRIIELLDGKVIADSRPFKDEKELKQTKEKNDRKTSMSFFTALSLSFKNLVTKKARTMITAFAGSIGIIGIALVLSLSNGFNNYIDKMQSDTLSTFPVEISDSAIDYASFLQGFEQPSGVKYPEVPKIFVNPLLDQINSGRIKNDITDEYIDYVNNIDAGLVYSIDLSTGLDISRNIFGEVEVNNMLVGASFRNMGSANFFNQMIDSADLLNSQFDIIEGKLPESANELLIVVDEYNRMTDMSLVALGLLDLQDDIEELDFSEVLAKKYYMLDNDQIYTRIQNTFVSGMVDLDAGLELSIVGIARANEQTQIASLSSGLYYTKALKDLVLEKNLTSEIVEFMMTETANNPFSGEPYDVLDEDNAVQQYESLLRRLGGSTKINQIRIYPVDFDAKEDVKAYLNAYNETVPAEEQIAFTDLMEVMVNSLNTMINTISIVLIAFTAISLVVSSIMIGIITYVSVIERTKEIGILRSIGARKKDISRVFNAETFIIGLTAGLFGVIVTALLTIPINMIIKSLVDGIGNIAALYIYHAIILIIISVILTFVSGLIPSRIAAKKDPVIALRTE